MFSLVKKGNVWYYTIESFEKTNDLIHCFTTKHGGVSKGCFESMNLRITSEDEKDNVLKNYKIISDTIGVDYKKLVLSKQVHSVKIQDVTKENWGNGLFYENKFESADALVTNEPGVPMVTFYADCVPVYLYDKEKKVLALVHSGWKGTKDKITSLTVEHMKKNYGCKSEDILAAIGPSVRVCHFEVKEDVANQFDERFVKRDREKIYVNLQECIISDMKDIGILQDHITDSKICTCCNNDLFYSHRLTGDKRGTMAAIAQIK